jgi:hypothetical protein
MLALGIAEDEAQNFLRDVGYEAKPQSDPTAEVVDWIATVQQHK